VITAGDVLNTADAKYCNIVTITVDQTDFTCADLGLNPVTVTMTDGFGESTTCNPTVTVVERSPNPCSTSFLNYCTATSTETTGEFIQSVTLGDLTNTSTGSLYTDFTTEIAVLEFGNFYDFEASDHCQCSRKRARRSTSRYHSNASRNEKRRTCKSLRLRYFW